MGSIMSDIAFEVVNLSKQYPGTLALSDVSLKLYDKKIHAIVGENGAGKSTLCKLITGNIQPTKGEMYLKGNRVVFKSPADSLKAGVCMLYQERNMVPTFTGAQNICLGSEPSQAGFINFREERKKAYDLARDLGVNLPLDEPIVHLSAGTQQMIEILRAFYHNPFFMILDEPTASLGEGEIEPFLEFVKRARDDMGLPIIYITHKLEEVFQIADQVTVLTDGKLVLSKPIGETNMKEVVAAMIRQAELDPVDVHPKQVLEDPILTVGPCTYDGYEHKLGFKLYQGKVMGFYGLVGSGRTECVEMLYGLRRAEKTDITFEGKKLTSKEIFPEGMINKGLILTPEIRAHGVFLIQTIEENINILFLNEKYTASFVRWVKRNLLRKFVHTIVEKHNIKMANVDQGILELSGGNMQKVIIGRSIEIDNNKIMIFDEPTNGIDIGAKYEIYRKIRRLAEEQNRAVLFVSSEINELLAICDQIYVFADGDIVGSFERNEFSKMEILNLALGRYRNE
jgi:ABC-type sugar transport system ATPase subunit